MKGIFNKKGQSLVEVTVALSLLALVIVGVVTLAVNAVGLMVSSRMKTEATAYAQEGLEDVKSSRSNTCDDLQDGANTEPPKLIGGTEYTRTTAIEPDSTFTDAKLVTVTVDWSQKGQASGGITLKQIMSAR